MCEDNKISDIAADVKCLEMSKLGKHAVKKGMRALLRVIHPFQEEEELQNSSDLYKFNETSRI